MATAVFPGRTLRIPAASTDDIWLPVAAAHPTLGELALSTQWSVQATVVLDDGLAPTAWLTAAWEATTNTFAGVDGQERTYHFARLRVGPGVGGQIVLAPGRFYRCWLRLTEISSGVASIVRHAQIEATP